MQTLAAVLFALALLHTFSTGFFENLAHRYPKHAGAWHFLAEVEVVFGFWAFLLVASLFALEGKPAAIAYLEGQNFTEPLFVFAIMVVAASRPIIHLARHGVGLLAHFIHRSSGLSANASFFFVTLSFVPLLGSFITEPAAMTLAAFILQNQYYRYGLPTRLKYLTLGILFVNVSIGGVLTPYAAPPVLMVAGKWNWDLAFMLQHFGWKAAIAVAVNALTLTLLYRQTLAKLPPPGPVQDSTPWSVSLIHLVFLIGIVSFAHHPVIFIGLLLFFIGFTQAYPQHQDRLILRESLMVGFFLAGLVVLGGLQKWWLQPLLQGLPPTALYYLATALTAITDNAALTYLGSLVENPNAAYQYALVAGAVTGGGLTVIANAPNPAGYALLREYFDDASINPLGLFAAAALPTVTAIIAFQVL